MSLDSQSGNPEILVPGEAAHNKQDVKDEMKDDGQSDATYAAMPGKQYTSTTTRLQPSRVSCNDC